MTPPIYTVLRRRSLRRPASILLVVGLVLFYFRGGVFDAQHSTRVAFRLTAGRRTVTETATVWATRTVTRSALPIPTEKPKAKASWLKKDASKKKSKQTPQGQHIYHPNGLLYVDPSGGHPIPELIARAEAQWARKLASASTSLRQAAAEYTRRYDRLPPKGFDLWWGYAMANNVQLPDEYDQIDRDLAPFYGVDPVEVQRVQREWEAHADSYTIGKDSAKEGLAMLNFTLPADERVRFELASGGFQLIELLREVEGALPPFRAVFSPHDNPNLVLDYQLRQQALDAAKKGTYIDPAHPPPQTHGWHAACPPLARTQLDALPPPPKTFIHAHLPAMDPCQHPAHLRAHGAYIAHGHGPTPHRALIPQFSYSVTPLHADIRVAMPLNWVSDDFPQEGQPPPVGLSWAQRTDARLQWRGSNTGIWHAADGRWKEAHRVGLHFFSQTMEAVHGKYAILIGAQEKKVVGAARKVPRARLLPALLDVAFAGAAPLNCEPSQCAVLGKMFEWRRAHDLQTAARYKYVLDVDGNGWSSRFKRLMNSGSLIFKASAYPEWFTDRLAPWVHYVPIQNSYTDLLDTLLFFRAHDERGARIAAAGREWSRRFWREEDLVAYNFRLFLEYARVMSTDRAAMSFVMWEDEREDEVRELALRAKWETKTAEAEDED
ncbi:glycosyl transferase family 90-domain-containing protein [Mycena metata]|uniref:Glycosyl transferase family 90-domain-containing protein n=1 Tax=Mycena metata TaxID=1033252 RepID=A0AAD7HHV4_9AGAR|nr:glycosyl transferase family 90-domain-containing protein [Mycena metata]